MMELIRKTNIDFMGLRKIAFAISGLLFILGVVGTYKIAVGSANLGVDLAGGTSIQVKFARAFDMEKVRLLMKNAGHPEATLQSVPSENILIVKVAGRGNKEKMVGEEVVGLLGQTFPDNKPTVESISEIGPAIGKKLRVDAVWAMLWAGLAIIIYLAWRFELKFGVAACIATFHDVFALIGIFWLLGREIDLLFITALLTIAGYSLTDTVVVFDRIRENIKLRKAPTFSDTVNVSVNEVLSRTIVTSLTVFITCIALLFFGGVVLKEFALALTMGVVIGTYSSIFVASPLIALWRGESMAEAK